MTPSALVVIDVEVGLPLVESSLIDDAVLKSKITERIVDLIDDLGLPATPGVRLAHTSSAHPLAGAQPSVAIAGQSCRQEVTWAPDADGGGIDRLANRLAAAVYWNRHLLLTRPLREELGGEGQGPRADLLPDLMLRGLSLGSAEAVVNGLDPNLPDHSRALEMELAIARSFPRLTTIEAGPGLYQRMIGASGETGERLGLMRDGLFYELGIRFPPCRITLSPALADDEFRFQIGAVRGPVTTGLASDGYLVNDTPARLELIGLTGRAVRNPANGMPAAIIAGAEAASQCESAGLTTWDRAAYVVLTLAWHLRAHADMFLTITEAQRTLSRLSEAFPLPIVDLLERYSPVYIVGVLRALVKEDVSIRDLRSVMEAMLEVGRSAPMGPEGCAEFVRVAMKNYLTHKYARDGELNVLETTDATEVQLQTPSESSQQDRAPLLQRVADAMQNAHKWRSIAILTSSNVRRRLRAAIEIEFPHVPVLSREEVTDLASRKTRGLIVWE